MVAITNVGSGMVRGQEVDPFHSNLSRLITKLENVDKMQEKLQPQANPFSGVSEQAMESKSSGMNPLVSKLAGVKIP